MAIVTIDGKEIDIEQIELPEEIIKIIIECLGWPQKYCSVKCVVT